jgi:hypothetical protein
MKDDVFDERVVIQPIDVIEQRFNNDCPALLEFNQGRVMSALRYLSKVCVMNCLIRACLAFA